MEQYISKDTLLAEMESLRCSTFTDFGEGFNAAVQTILKVIDTLETKEVDIASMADEYYDALIKEAEMDVDMAGHCRLAYYNGCKDVLNKIQKGD